MNPQTSTEDVYTGEPQDYPELPPPLRETDEGYVAYTADSHAWANRNKILLGFGLGLAAAGVGLYLALRNRNKHEVSPYPELELEEENGLYYLQVEISHHEPFILEGYTLIDDDPANVRYEYDLRIDPEGTTLLHHSHEPLAIVAAGTVGVICLLDGVEYGSAIVDLGL